MINLESEFSPRVNPADANYPFGSIKDNTSPGANDGTPLAAVWGNDWEGFAQAAMTEAGITPSGLPDTAQDSQLLAAVKVVASGMLRDELAAPGGAGLVSFQQSGTGAVERTAESKLREIVSIKDFGAKGDGVTDDTLAFENALVAANGGMVYVPPATYVVNNMSKPPRLEGDQANRAILICTLPNSCVLLNPAGSQHPANSVIVKNLILDTTSTNCNAYRADYAGGLSYTDSALFYNVETSQKFKASYVGNFIFSKWIYCADGKYGGAPTQIHQFLVATQYGQVNDNLFDQCRIYHSGDGNNGIKPFELYWANGNTFNKCNFEFCYGGIMKLTGGYGNAFNNCWIEIGLFPSLPTATLPTELFLLEYAASGAGTGSQPRSFTLNGCIIAIGDSVNKFGLRNGGAIFKSSNGSGGEWGLINCVFYGSRPGAINLYSGAFPESRVVWNNVGNSGGIDSAISFADFWVTAKIIGQKQIEYAPRLYVIQTLQEPTYTSRKGYCVVGEKTIEVFFDINWTNLPNTGSYSLAVSLPVEIRTPRVDVYTRVIRLSGMSATINNYEIIGKLTENTKVISLHIKPANTPDTTTALPPAHAASGRITGSLTFNTL